ncbi:MAG TPA: hypothetical protein VK324_15480 [Tepidisphaeraceae bacterium]|nr:hypothetical protein [Tepidisphaeraceae bacterium]
MPRFRPQKTDIPIAAWAAWLSLMLGGASATATAAVAAGRAGFGAVPLLMAALLLGFIGLQLAIRCVRHRVEQVAAWVAIALHVGSLLAVVALIVYVTRDAKPG